MENDIFALLYTDNNKPLNVYKILLKNEIK